MYNDRLTAISYMYIVMLITHETLFHLAFGNECHYRSVDLAVEIHAGQLFYSIALTVDVCIFITVLKIDGETQILLSSYLYIN